LVERELRFPRFPRFQRVSRVSFQGFLVVKTRRFLAFHSCKHHLIVLGVGSGAVILYLFKLGFSCSVAVVIMVLCKLLFVTSTHLTTGGALLYTIASPNLTLYCDCDSLL